MTFDASLTELRGEAMYELNDAVTAFQKEFHAIMKSKGYERKTSIQSALYHWEYTKDKRRISIDGWHGTGKRGTSRHYGDSKTFFSLYDSAVPGYKAITEARNTAPAGSLGILVAEQYAAMKEALKYARNL